MVQQEAHLSAFCIAPAYDISTPTCCCAAVIQPCSLVWLCQCPDHIACHPPPLLHPMQYLGRFALLLDPDNPNSYTKTSTPVPNADLDPLLVVPCPVTLNPTGKCAVRKDTQLVLPATYTRIAFHAPARSGLYVWHW